MNKRVLSFVLSHLHLISLFNKIKEFSLKNNVFEITVENPDTKDMEWKHLKMGIENAMDIIEDFRTIKQGNYLTAIITFKDDKINKQREIKRDLEKII